MVPDLCSTEMKIKACMLGKSWFWHFESSPATCSLVVWLMQDGPSWERSVVLSASTGWVAAVCHFYQAFSLLSLSCRWSQPDRIRTPYLMQLRKHSAVPLFQWHKSHEISAIYMLSEPIRSSCAFFFTLKWCDCNVIIFKPNSLSKSDVNPMSPK